LFVYWKKKRHELTKETWLRSKVETLQRIIKDLKLCPEPFCGFRVEVRVKMRGTDMLASFICETELLNFNEALMQIGNQPRSGLFLCEDGFETQMLSCYEHLKRIDDAVKFLAMHWEGDNSNSLPPEFKIM
jgi:hypothetical protein